MDIANFAQDHPTIHKTNAGDGHNDRVQAGLEEMLEFEEGLVDIGSQLYFQACTLLDGLLTKPAQFLFSLFYISISKLFRL